MPNNVKPTPEQQELIDAYVANMMKERQLTKVCEAKTRQIDAAHDRTIEKLNEVSQAIAAGQIATGQAFSEAVADINSSYQDFLVQIERLEKKGETNNG